MAFCKNTTEMENGLPISKIPTYRYEELVAREEELRLLKKAIANLEGYVNLDNLKATFDIKKGATE
jgi:hypothetical protein